MTEEKLKEMAKPNKVGRAREFLQQGRKDKVYGENEYYRKGFLDGGLYADSHPKNPWISVEERLPEKYVDCDGVEYDCSDRVIVKLKDGTCAHLAEYYHDTNEWLSLELCSSTDYYDKVTHWMPIPQIEKGE